MAEERGGFLSMFRRNVPPTETGGVPGIAIHGGFIDEPELNPDLQGQRKYTTFSGILANTAIVAAGVRFFLNLTAKATWKAEPNPDAADPELAQEVADFVQKAMEDMRTPWPRVVRRAAMFKFFGFSIQEWTAKRLEDGRIGMLDVAPRPQHTVEKWDCEDDGEILGVVQRSPQTGEELYLPRGKIVYVVDDSLSDSPEGLGLLRNVAESCKRLSRYEQLEGFGYETDLRGIPIARAPLAELQRLVDNGTLTEAQAAERTAFLVTFIQKHIKNPQLGLMMDSAPYQSTDERGQPVNVPQWDVKLMEGGGSSMEAVAQAVERLNREIARILGVEMLLIGSGGGSLALHRDKTQTFGLMVDSTLTELEFVFRNDFARVLVVLNGWPEDTIPKLNTEQVQFRDVEQLTQALRDLSDAGAPLTPADPVINQIRELLGLVGMPQKLVDAMLEDARLMDERNRELAEQMAGGGGGDGDDPPPEPRADDDETPPAQGESEE